MHTSCHEKATADGMQMVIGVHAATLVNQHMLHCQSSVLTLLTRRAAVTKSTPTAAASCSMRSRTYTRHTHRHKHIGSVCFT
jgi:hypothetical protein